MISSKLVPGVFRHINCRNCNYPKSTIQRSPVPDEFVFWTEDFSEYTPTEYTAPHIGGQPWADAKLQCPDFQPQWNSLDGTLDRRTFMGKYEILDGYPINPIGRTGLQGRGLLGRWGPNHAADPLVTRWKRDNGGSVICHSDSAKPILQMVVIQRGDNKMWAIPGGMVDAGEKVSATLKREFMEEALACFGNPTILEKFFQNGEEVYKGYVDDSRNTDNAWIETVACHFHDSDGTQMGQLRLSAGDDAINVKWTDVNCRLLLHANHIDFVKLAVDRLQAHW